MAMLGTRKTLFPSFFVNFGVDGEIEAEWALGYDLSAANRLSFLLSLL